VCALRGDWALSDRGVDIVRAKKTSLLSLAPPQSIQ